MAAGRGPEPVPRPYIPPAAALALSLAVCSALLMELFWRTFAEGRAGPCPAVPASASLGLAAASLGLLRGRAGGSAARRYAAAALAGAALAAFPCWSAAGARATAWEAISSSPASSLVFQVEGDPRRGARGEAVDAAALDGGRRVALVELAPVERLEAGERVRCVGRVRRVEDGGWGRSRYMGGVVATVDVVRVMAREPGGTGPVGDLRAAALDAIAPASSAQRALVAGIVCGRTTELGGLEAQEDFSRTGTSHLVAVSGGHLALVSGLAMIALGRIGLAPGPRAAVLLPLMAAYVLFTGASASAVRSLAMVAAAMGSRLAGRRSHGISGLSLAVTALLVLEPGSVYDIGFQLSAASVLFITLFSGHLDALLRSARVPAALAGPLSLALCAQWGTLPVTVPAFGELSLVSPLANLALGPVMGLLLSAGVAGTLVSSVLSWDPALIPADALARASILIAGAMSDLPLASLPVGTDAGAAAAALCYGGAVLTYAVWRMPPGALVAGVPALLLAAAILHVARWSALAPPSVTVLDVGQGDAVLIRDGSRSMLVDCGVDEGCARALLRSSAYGLDAVAITHWDLDHWGGLEGAARFAGAPLVLVPEGARSAVPAGYGATGAPAPEEVSVGDEIRVGRFTCTVLWPRGPVAGGENAESLVLLVRFDDGSRSLSVLLTGDTESGELDGYIDAAGRVDVLKLGHHGSAESCTAEQVRRLGCAVAVASAGEGNRYGHPDPAAVDAVRRGGAEFLCTIECGDVTFEPGEGGFRYATGRSG